MKFHALGLSKLNPLTMLIPAGVVGLVAGMFGSLAGQRIAGQASGHAEAMPVVMVVTAGGAVLLLTAAGVAWFFLTRTAARPRTAAHAAAPVAAVAPVLEPVIAPPALEALELANDLAFFHQSVAALRDELARYKEQRALLQQELLHVDWELVHTPLPTTIPLHLTTSGTAQETGTWQLHPRAITSKNPNVTVLQGWDGSAQVPDHGWTPAARHTPSPMSSFRRPAPVTLDAVPAPEPEDEVTNGRRRPPIVPTNFLRYACSAESIIRQHREALGLPALTLDDHPTLDVLVTGPLHRWLHPYLVVMDLPQDADPHAQPSRMLRCSRSSWEQFRADNVQRGEGRLSIRWLIAQPRINDRTGRPFDARHVEGLSVFLPASHAAEHRWCEFEGLSPVEAWMAFEYIEAAGAVDWAEDTAALRQMLGDPATAPEILEPRDPALRFHLLGNVANPARWADSPFVPVPIHEWFNVRLGLEARPTQPSHRSCRYLHHPNPALGKFQDLFMLSYGHAAQPGYFGIGSLAADSLDQSSTYLLSPEDLLGNGLLHAFQTEWDQSEPAKIYWL